MSDKAKILIVDDEADLLSVLVARFGREGFEVLTSDNGSDAIEIVRAHRPDVIIMDVKMPDVSGGAVGLSLKEDPATKDIPIIFLSGTFAGEEEHGRSHGFGGNIKIAKPYEFEDLLNAVRGQLGVVKNST